MLRINFEGLCFGVTVEQGTQTRLEEKEVLLLFFFLAIFKISYVALNNL